MKTFEFTFKAVGYGADADEALENILTSIKESPEGTIEPDVVFEEIPPDAACLALQETLRTVSKHMLPWNTATGKA